jgi:thiol-disulfide isomerase/thioredoxin
MRGDARRCVETGSPRLAASIVLRQIQLVTDTTPPRRRFGAVTWSRWRRWLTPWNVVTIAIAVWAAPRLLPHVAAVAGIDTGDHRAPRYDVTTLDGVRHTSESLRGRVVLVNVWATWCGPCRAEMPLLQRMYARHRDAGLVVLGLSVDRASQEAVRAFVQQRGVTYPVAVVGTDGVGPFGGVRGYPTSFLIDRDGIVRHQVLGPLAPASLEPAVRRLLATPAQRSSSSASSNLR